MTPLTAAERQAMREAADRLKEVWAGWPARTRRARESVLEDAWRSFDRLLDALAAVEKERDEARSGREFWRKSFSRALGLLSQPDVQEAGRPTYDQAAAAPTDRAPHEFVGRTDRWCEVCDRPDRHPVHVSAPVVQEADDSGTCETHQFFTPRACDCPATIEVGYSGIRTTTALNHNAPTVADVVNDAQRHPATVEQPNGTDSECGHTWHVKHSGGYGYDADGCYPEPCPSESDKGEQ